MNTRRVTAAGDIEVEVAIAYNGERRVVRESSIDAPGLIATRIALGIADQEAVQLTPDGWSIHTTPAPDGGGAVAIINPVREVVAVVGLGAAGADSGTWQAMLAAMEGDAHPSLAAGPPDRPWALVTADPSVTEDDRDAGQVVTIMACVAVAWHTQETVWD